MALRHPEPLHLLSPVSVAPAPVLSIIPGGLNKPGTVTVDRADWDEAQMEVSVLRSEARAFVGRTLPLARRMELATHDLGPVAHQTTAALIHALEAYGRRNAEPDDAA